MRLTLPNLLSVLRIGLVPLFIIAVLDARPGTALVLMLVAGVTDALDGLAARYLHQQSLLGSYLDPIADKLLLASAYVVLAIPGIHAGVTIPVWVTVLVLSRDVIILGLALVLSLTFGRQRFPPSWISKLNTTAQIVAVILVLISGLWPLLAGVATWSLMAVAVLTILSGLQYAQRMARITGGGGASPEAEPASLEPGAGPGSPKG
ncbi:MAG: CDP-alcohol phosphatidyltransferase family protein [Acidobacteria bacterium]|nr:CDP-alcohol phosphatidyltransferase family protein [Acidobacteriota bacterium]